MKVVETLNVRAGCGLQVVEWIEQGQSGAAFVRWPDGRDAVVTTALATMERMQQTAAILGDLKAQRFPVPEHQFLYPLDDGTVAVVQERLPGTPVVDVDVDVVDAIIAINERFAGLMVGRSDIPMPALNLGRPTDATSGEHLETHSSRTRTLLQLIQKTAGGDDMVGDDLLHTDLTVPNVLFDQHGTISGVIDWNYGIARGDRYYALSKLLHTLSFAALTPTADHHPSAAAVRRVDDYLTSAIDPATLRRYWAHHTLGMLYWMIRNENHAATNAYIELGESKLT